MARKLIRFVGLMIAVFAAAIVAWWIVAAPPEYITIAPAYKYGPVSDELIAAQVEGDPISASVYTFAKNIPGYDDIVLQEHLNRAWATGRDGWIYKVDLEAETVERFVDAPLMAAGANALPGTDDEICFCSSYLHGENYPKSERVGLYRLDLNTREITTVFDRVPLPLAPTEPPAGNEGFVYGDGATEALALNAMDDSNSRPLAFCNDFAVSTDGKRFYVSEPFAYPGASMGGGTYNEAISLGKNGNLWLFDAETQTARLVAQGYNFIDGVLLENGAEGRETSVLISETPKFRIMRFYLTGDRAGTDEIVQEFLPSMPDGLDRAEDGTIWIGMLKKRTPLLTWVHENPWAKHVMLRVPREYLPVPTDTAVLVLSEDASTPLWYAEHNGTSVQDIAAVSPGESGVYLSNFGGATPGVHRIPNPLADQ